MNLLAIDCAGPVLSTALSRGDEIFYEAASEGMKQSELVMDFIDSLFKKGSLKPSDLNGVLCMGGPGSFTGLRIGYSAAKGLALALSIPFSPVPTLDCIASQRTMDCGGDAFSSLQLAVIQARKNAWFYAFYRGEKRLTSDGDGDLLQISEEINSYNEEILLSGPGSALLYDSLSENKKNCLCLNNNMGGYAREIIYIAKKRNIPDNDSVSNLYSGPEYIRKTDAELNLYENAGV